MDAEFLELARAATGALQMQAAAATRGPSWVEMVQALSSVVGLGCIVGGLFAMRAAGQRRDREIDELAAAFRKQGEAHDRQGAAMTQAFTQQGQALERQGEVLAKIGQALDRQGAAMTQAFTQQGQALERQGRALETLIERTAAR